MLICLIGHSASGKSTIQNKMKKFVPPIVQFTTRPIRSKEINGKDYQFIYEERFFQLRDQNFFDNIFVTKNDWYYGISLKDYDYKHKDYSLVCTPESYIALSERLDKKYMKSFYIHLTEHQRVIRMANRKDRIEEMFRRILSDREDFVGFDSVADVVLTSTNSTQNYKEILSIIKEDKIYEK